MRNLFQNIWWGLLWLWGSRTGAAKLEYALLAAFITLAAVIGIEDVGNVLGRIIKFVIDLVVPAMDNAPVHDL